MEILRGRELDAKIAESEGWVWVYDTVLGINLFMPHDDAEYCVSASVGIYTYTIPAEVEFKYPEAMPEWSRDMAYVFDLMDNSIFEWKSVESKEELRVWCSNGSTTSYISVNLDEFDGREDAYATAYCNTYLEMLKLLYCNTYLKMLKLLGE